MKNSQFHLQKKAFPFLTRRILRQNRNTFDSSNLSIMV